MDELPPFLTGQQGIAKAAELLKAGHCVAVPTETVYGLAADAFNETAVRDIFAIKNRPFIDPLIVHIYVYSQLAELTELSEQHLASIKRVTGAFWPGPLTLVLPKSQRVPDLVTANRDSVAIRCPAHAVMRELLRHSGLCLAAPSANPFGYISPTTAQHVRDSLGQRCPHILDGGPCEKGVESTILDLRDPARPILLRPGPLGREALEQALQLEIGDPAADDSPTLAPGMMERHYSPSKPLVLYPVSQLPPCLVSEVCIHLKRPTNPQPGEFWLSENGNLEEAAANLFQLLRKLDQNPAVRHIHCETPPSGPGVADAIRDRLQRASQR